MSTAPSVGGGPPAEQGSPSPRRPSCRLLFIFLDGVGIGEADDTVNPFFAATLEFFLRHLGSLPSLAAPRVSGSGGTAFPLEATLGVEGLPQSGTGQYSLLTGINGAERIGRHFGPWTPTALRESLAERSLLAETLHRDLTVAFANAYPRSYRRARWFQRPAPVPFAADAAGLIDRHIEALMGGRAVASDILNERLRRHTGAALPDVTANEAGRNLAALAASTDLTFFAHYATDTAGHAGDLDRSRDALELVDRFLSGIVAERSPDQAVLIASDHGNIEAVAPGHTRNPALGIWLPPPSWGAGDAVGPLPRSLLEVAPFVHSLLGPIRTS